MEYFTYGYYIDLVNPKITAPHFLLVHNFSESTRFERKEVIFFALLWERNLVV